jgi:hypothetical protein
MHFLLIFSLAALPLVIKMLENFRVISNIKKSFVIAYIVSLITSIMSVFFLNVAFIVSLHISSSISFLLSSIALLALSMPNITIYKQKIIKTK